MNDSNFQAASEYLSLKGEPVSPANPIDADGIIRNFSTPGMRLFRTNGVAKGTVLLLPGGGYNVLEVRREGANTARFLNTVGFDVAVLEYHVALGPQLLGSEGRALALANALEAFRFLRRSGASLELRTERMALMGYSAGGHLAARTAQALAPEEQPCDLILVYPAFLQERLTGETTPAVLPPEQPGHLFALIADNDNADWVPSCREYVAAWTARGGKAAFHLLQGAGHGFGIEADPAESVGQWPSLLQAYFDAGA